MDGREGARDVPHRHELVGLRGPDETGAWLTIIIAAVTLYMQFQDPAYRGGMMGVAIWYAAGIVYFALYGRKTLVYSPEEDFAVKAHAQAEAGRA